MTEEHQKEIATLTEFIKRMEEISEVSLESEWITEDEHRRETTRLTVAEYSILFPSIIRPCCTKEVFTGISQEMSNAIKKFTEPQILSAKKRIALILGFELGVK